MCIRDRLRLGYLFMLGGHFMTITSLWNFSPQLMVKRRENVAYISRVHFWTCLIESVRTEKDISTHLWLFISSCFLSAVQQRPSWIHWSRKAFWVVQSKQRGVCSRKVGSPPWHTEMISEPIRTVETHHVELRSSFKNFSTTLKFRNPSYDVDVSEDVSPK